MTCSTAILAACAFAATALAQSAIVAIESSHGGAGEGLVNNTISVPLNTDYTNIDLQDVSYLYLIGSITAPVESITCTPYLYPNGTGKAGFPFNFTDPAYLSTNDVQVGSLVCVSTDTNGTSSASSANSSTFTSITSSTSATTSVTSIEVSITSTISGPSKSSSDDTSTTASSTSSSSSWTVTSIYTTTTAIPDFPLAPGLHNPTETVTRTTVISGFSSVPTSPSTSSGASVVEGASATSSATPGLSSVNAADRISMSGGVAAAMALALMGLAFIV